MTGVTPRHPVPPLSVSTISGENRDLADRRPAQFTMIAVTAACTARFVRPVCVISKAGRRISRGPRSRMFSMRWNSSPRTIIPPAARRSGTRDLASRKLDA